MATEVPSTARPDTTMLAAERTRLAYDRTLLAWVRTATALISFGFTIHKFFEYLRHAEGPRPDGLFEPRRAGMLMIAIGVAGLVIATRGHRRDMRLLRAQFGQLRGSDVTLLPVLLIALGTLGLAAVAAGQ